MTIGIIGNGKMGRVISDQLLQSEVDHWVVGRSDDLQSQMADRKPDVLIEFTEAAQVLHHIEIACASHIPIVVGTTGWYDSWAQAETMIHSSGSALFYATNFSVGAHLFWQFNALIADRMQKHADYTSSIHECHHPEKRDAPSGTAITTAEHIIGHNKNYSGWSLVNDNEKTTRELIAVSAERKTGVHGLHETSWTSEIDQIKISHEAFSRAGFASGAIKAAHFLLNKKGIFTMDDLIGI